jgi:PmbA protein
LMSDKRDKTGPSATPLDIARLAVERAGSLDADVEAYVQFGRTVSIKVFGGEVESVTVAQPRGVGIRAVCDGRTGYAFSTDVSESGVLRALGQAKADLEVADPDPYCGLPNVDPSEYRPLGGLWQPGVSAMSLEQKTGLALQAEATALSIAGVEAVEESVYEDEEEHVAMASTLGVEAEAKQSYCFVYSVAHAGQDADKQSGLGFDAGRDPTCLDPTLAGREAADKALALVGSRPCKSGLYDLVLDREVAAALLSTVVQALSAEAAQKGRSVFAGKLGSKVGSSLLTILDDGLNPEGMATCVFDGEGVPQRVTTLLDGGILKSFLHDTRSARREGGGAISTGSARRSSYRTLPRVGASNLVVRPGAGTFEELLARVGEGLYVGSVAGLHAGVNPVSGEISLGVSGCLIQKGITRAPVREVTIATDFGAFLSSVCDIAADSRWIPLYGSVCTPTLVVQGVAVSGV